MAELFFKGGQVTGLGLLAVFAIIAIIFFAIKGMGLISQPKKSKKCEKFEAPEAPAEDHPVAAPATAVASDDAALIAVLAAAVAAYTGESVTKFRVVSFKHIK
jgi:sodium pump decarboxylase gamma subunit